MKKFKFNLENVLKQREILQKLAQKKYFDQKRKIRAEKLKALSTMENIKKMHNELNELQLKGEKLTINEIFEYRNHIDHLEQSLELIKQNIANLENDLVSIHQALVTASQNKKIILRLKDKAYQNYLDAINKAEEKFLDEITTTMSSRVNK